MWISRHACNFLIKLRFALQIFEISSNINFSWKSVQWKSSYMRTDGQRERYDMANSRFSQFYEHTYWFSLKYFTNKEQILVSSYQPCASVYALIF